MFNSPEQMQVKIDEYFALCDSATKKVILKDENGAQYVDEISNPEPYTIPGLAYHLGFCQRQELAEYARNYAEFSATIHRARLKIEAQRIKNCSDVDTKNSNGIKFDLTNNFNYKDLQQIEVIGELSRITECMLQVIKKYVPIDKQSDAVNEVQTAIDFQA